MEEVIEKITKILGDDASAIKEFLANPKEVLEKHNLHFDKEELEHIVEAVKANVNLEEIAEKGEELLDNIKGFFHK